MMKPTVIPQYLENTHIQEIKAVSGLKDSVISINLLQMRIILFIDLKINQVNVPHL